MKKITLLGIIIAVYFMALPSTLFAKQPPPPDPPCSTTGNGEICEGNTLSFEAVDINNAGDAADAVAQIKVQINDYDSGNGITFHFSNEPPLPDGKQLTISSIIFAECCDDENPLVFDYANFDLNGTPGDDAQGKPNVGFQEGNAPTIPQIIPEYQLELNALPPPAKTGIDPGEWLDVSIAYDNATFGEFANKLAWGSFTIGLHVINFGSGTDGSEKLISLACLPGPSGTNPIPEPATMLLLGTGLIGIAGTVRRRKKMPK